MAPLKLGESFVGQFFKDLLLRRFYHFSIFHLFVLSYTRIAGSQHIRSWTILCHYIYYLDLASICLDFGLPSRSHGLSLLGWHSALHQPFWVASCGCIERRSVLLLNKSHCVTTLKANGQRHTSLY